MICNKISLSFSFDFRDFGRPKATRTLMEPGAVLWGFWNFSYQKNMRFCIWTNILCKHLTNFTITKRETRIISRILFTSRHSEFVNRHYFLIDSLFNSYFLLFKYFIFLLWLCIHTHCFWGDFWYWHTHDSISFPTGHWNTVKQNQTIRTQ